MRIIDDRPFLRQMSRRFLDRPSRFLDGSPIAVNDAGPNIEIHITNGVYSMFGIAWVKHRAVLLPGSSVLSAHDLFGLEEALTDLVRRFLRKHGFITSRRQPTRRRTA